MNNDGKGGTALKRIFIQKKPELSLASWPYYTLEQWTLFHEPCLSVLVRCLRLALVSTCRLSSDSRSISVRFPRAARHWKLYIILRALVFGCPVVSLLPAEYSKIVFSGVRHPELFPYSGLLGSTVDTCSCVNLWSFWTFFLRTLCIWQSPSCLPCQRVQVDRIKVGDDFRYYLDCCCVFRHVHVH